MEPAPIRTQRLAPEIFSLDLPGEACAMSKVKGWEKVRLQVDSGAIDPAGPKEIAKAFKMKENEMSKMGLVYVAASGSKIDNNGEKRIVGHVRKVLGSVHKMNLGGSMAALDGNRSYTQNEETGQKTRIEYEEGQRTMYLRAPSNRRSKGEEENETMKGNKFAILAAEKEETTKVSTRRA